MPASYGGLPFQEQIDFFRKKNNRGTEDWQDTWQEAHDRAFVVAGAQEGKVLTDLRAAVQKAIEKGTTIEEFRKDFDKVIEATGWKYKGGRNWRTRVIFDTNLRTSYAAGRYKQLQEVKESRPFWEYRLGDSLEHRVEHMAWNGLVLPADHPFWNTHAPPNGWGCKCRLFALNLRDLKKVGKDGPDQAPDDGTYQWTDKNGDKHTIPNGIDPGWAYAPGKSTYTPPPPPQNRRIEPLTGMTFADYGRPALVPVDTVKAILGPGASTEVEARTRLADVLGGREKVFTVELGDTTEVVRIRAWELAHHLALRKKLDRVPYLTLLPELIGDPFEVWVELAQDLDTEEYLVRQKFIKGVSIHNKLLLLVVQAENAELVDVTFYPVDTHRVNEKRSGVLLYGR